MSELTPADYADGAAVGDATDRDYLVRSEEQLRTGIERFVSGYARLEKFVVTETRTITVEVSHEEFRVVNTPVNESDVGRSQARNEDSPWLQLSREEVVITKRIVPVERIRLEVYSVTAQRQITEQLSKEQIDVGHLPVDSDHHH